jgi:hypothetical protein
MTSEYETVVPVLILVGEDCEVENVVGVGEFKYVIDAVPFPFRVAFTKEVPVIDPR